MTQIGEALTHLEDGGTVESSIRNDGHVLHHCTVCDKVWVSKETYTEENEGRAKAELRRQVPEARSNLRTRRTATAVEVSAIKDEDLMKESRPMVLAYEVPKADVARLRRTLGDKMEPTLRTTRLLRLVDVPHSSLSTPREDITADTQQLRLKRIWSAIKLPESDLPGTQEGL